MLVRIFDLEAELRQSKPEAQVVPMQAVAGFDINFNAKTLGKFKSVFSWAINGIHLFKVAVVAEVVPIEILLSASSLSFEFPPESLEHTISQEIVLTNPGNAAAEFLWGNAGAFQCKPEKGVVHPGNARIITVSWRPVAGKRYEEEIGLHYMYLGVSARHSAWRGNSEKRPASSTRSGSVSEQWLSVWNVKSKHI